MFFPTSAVFCFFNSGCGKLILSYQILLAMKTLNKLSALGLVLLTFLTFNASAQTGEIRGYVTDSITGKAIDGVTVSVIDRGNPKVTLTDATGFYSIKPLNPGTYNVAFTYFGTKPKEIQGIPVSAEGMYFLDQAMMAGISTGTVVVKAGEYKPIDMRKDPGVVSIPAIDIIRNGTGRDINSNLIAYVPTVKPVDRAGKQLSIAGSRPDATQYYVDGVKIIGELNIPQTGIEEITVISGGLPAKYGDTTSGVVLITTKSFR